VWRTSAGQSRSVQTRTHKEPPSPKGWGSQCTEGAPSGDAQHHRISPRPPRVPAGQLEVRGSTATTGQAGLCGSSVCPGGCRCRGSSGVLSSHSLAVRSVDLSEKLCGVTDTSSSRLGLWWNALTGRQQLGYCLSGAAIALTIVLALLRGVTSVAPGWTLFIVVLGIVAQSASTLIFSSVGRADPTHAAASIDHLMTLANRCQNARVRAEKIFETQTRLPKDLHVQLGKLSSDLSYIEEDAERAVRHWELFQPDAVRQATEIRTPRTASKEETKK